MAGIRIIDNSSEIGAGTRGSGLGPIALRYAAIKNQSDYFQRYPIRQITHYNSELRIPSTYSHAWYIDHIVQVYRNVSNGVSDTLNSGDFPVILAGDHSSAGASIAGIRKQYPDKRLGVIWIDAHADLHSPYTTPSGNVHGMPLATAIGEDNITHAINQPSEGCLAHWENLKHLNNQNPKISPADIVFFGVRDTEVPEEALMEKFSIPNFTVDQCRTRGIVNCVSNALSHLEKCDLIYISFDVDSMDSETVSSGTGTPVPNGFKASEAQEIIETIIQKSDKLCAFEIVEINPLLDREGNKMAEVSFQILDQVTSKLESKFSNLLSQ